MSARRRLDREMVRRGLVWGPGTEASEVIGAGRVTVDGAPADKASPLGGARGRRWWWPVHRPATWGGAGGSWRRPSRASDWIQPGWGPWTSDPAPGASPIASSSRGRFGGCL
ncbi:MAG: hypothetical protein Ct9H300mP12_00930 [Acidimicrobiales bacterium]|nr:MAG: hypothetical protein Ct9H300mP12_00930 [Acidimicrobiales bacterium]